MNNDGGFLPGLAAGLAVGVLFMLAIGGGQYDALQQEAVDRGFAAWKPIDNGNNNEFVWKVMVPEASDRPDPSAS